jgi:hypothetical protein
LTLEGFGGLLPATVADSGDPVRFAAINADNAAIMLAKVDKLLRSAAK